jgi:RecA/RadA recombinase
MTANETKRYTMLMRVRDFGLTHKEVSEHTAVAQEQFAAVAAAVKALSEHDVMKMSAARQGSVPKTAARLALVDQLGAISRTARAMAMDTPGLKAAFPLPHGLSEQALLTSGRLFVRDAEALSAAFVLNGMPPTFIAELRAHVDQFDRAIQESETERSEHISARAHIEAALTSGTAAVKRLDAIVTNQLRKDPVTMTVWKRARRLGSHARIAVTAPAPSTPDGTESSAGVQA